jgi:glutamyl-tRNA reductase
VRTLTEITRGAVSVGSVAVDLAEQIFGNFETRKVLLLGAGEASERTARALAKRGVRDIRVMNRSAERAEALAALINGRAVTMEDWEMHCREVDILISSTAAPTPFVTRANLGPLLHDRLNRPLFIIDIAVPRDVAPDVNELEGVFLYDIDSLQSIAQQSLAQRQEQIAAGEKIIAGHVDDFSDWFVAAGERRLGVSGLSEPSLRPSES